MTDPSDDIAFRQALRDTLADRVATLPPPVGTYESVRRLHRRSRRRTVVAAVLAAVVALVGVPAAFGLARGGGPTTPANSSTGPTRGSLGGDRALIDAAVRLFLGDGGRGASQAGDVDGDTVRVPYAEEHEGYQVVVVVGRQRRTGSVLAILATSAPGGPLVVNGGTSGTPQAVDARLGQQYLAPQHVLTRFAIGAQSFGVALFPPGYRATIRLGATVGADCRRDEARPADLPLVDGAAFFPVEREDAPYVSVYEPGARKPLVARPLEPTGGGPAVIPPGGSLPPSDGSGSAVLPLPPEGEIAAQLIATMRGNAAESAIRDVAGYAETVFYGVGVGELPDRYVGVWAGRLPSGSGIASLWGGQYRSGATVLQGYSTEPDGQGYAGWTTGCLPAGGADRLVLAVRLAEQPDKPLVVVAPARATRAEVRFGGSWVPVQLVEGGGFLVHEGTPLQVRAYDSAGRVVATGVPGGGLVGVPLQPR